MTIIVALHQAGKTWIGGDSRQCLQGQKLPTTVQKWSYTGNRALGVAGDGRAAGLVERHIGDILFPEDDPFEVAERVIRTLEAAKWNWSTEPGARCAKLSMIYASPAGVWDFDASLFASRINDGYLWARGSGMDYAVGADSALRAFAITDAGTRVRAALDAAIENDTGCGAPVFVRCLS